MIWNKTCCLLQWWKLWWKIKLWIKSQWPLIYIWVFSAVFSKCSKYRCSSAVRYSFHIIHRKKLWIFYTSHELHIWKQKTQTFWCPWWLKYVSSKILVNFWTWLLDFLFPYESLVKYEGSSKIMGPTKKGVT